MQKAVKILFVCTGNIFRSMSAEYCLKDYLSRKNIQGITVSSAGTIAKKEGMNKQVHQTLLSKHIHPNKHIQRRITKRIYDQNDLIIVMAQNHYDRLKQLYGEEKIVLYKEVLLGKKLSLRDVNEEIPDYIERPKQTKEYLTYVVNYIYNHTEQFYKHLQKYILFRQFVLGGARRNGGLNFVPLYETENTLAFMSIDIPSTQDGHIIIIPKQIYLSIHSVPKSILHELIESVQFIGEAVAEHHGGYHILLNEGKASNRSMNHVHFHIIPRRKGDTITLETWRKKSLNEKNFKMMNEAMLQVINQKLKSRN